MYINSGETLATYLPYGEDTFHAPIKPILVNSDTHFEVLETQKFTKPFEKCLLHQFATFVRFKHRSPTAEDCAAHRV